MFCRGDSGTVYMESAGQLVTVADLLLGPLAIGHVVREHRHLARQCNTVVIPECLCVSQALVTSVWVGVRWSVRVRVYVRVRAMSLLPCVCVM